MLINTNRIEFGGCGMKKKEIAREVAVKWILSGITVNEEEQLNKILSKIHTENK